MLYGYREIIDGQIASVVPAADTIEEYESWVGLITVQEPRINFSGFSASSLIDHMFREEYSGYKRPVLVLFHSDNEQRDKFFNEWSIKEVKSLPARDRQKDMIWKSEQAALNAERDAKIASVEAEGGQFQDQTLAEICGLTEEDPWDKRTDKEKEQDENMKKQMKDLQKKGEISGDSFGSAKEIKEARAAERAGNTEKKDNGVVGVTDIRIKRDEEGNAVVEDGEYVIDNALAHKWGGEIDTELGAERANDFDEKVKAAKGGKDYFDPEDFAEVLRGDGSADHLNVPADPGSKMRMPANPRPSLSDHAEAVRKVYQAEEARLKEEAETKKREQEDIVAAEEHSNGIFRGCDLFPDQKIKLEDLPETLRETIGKNVKATVFPLKDYPYNSQIGDRALLPNGNDSNRDFKIAQYDNLEQEGVISSGDCLVNIVKKTEADKPGWGVYIMKNPAITETTIPEELETIDKILVSIVRIR